MTKATRFKRDPKSESDGQWFLRTGGIAMVAVMAGAGVGLLHWMLVEESKQKAAIAAPARVEESQSAASDDFKARLAQPARKAVKTW